MPDRKASHAGSWYSSSGILHSESAACIILAIINNFV